MAWTVTINNLQKDTRISQETIEYYVTHHIKYPGDMLAALKLAKNAGLASCVLTGARTPNPSGGDEVIDISVRGLTQSPNYADEIKRIIRMGPDE